MRNFFVTFSVDGKRTQQQVVAFSVHEAKQMIESQYYGSRIAFVNVKDLGSGNYV